MKLCPACGLRTATGEVCPKDGARLTDSDPLLGRLLKGRYRLDQRLAQGGMGAIYKSTQINLNRIVAVKVLIETLAQSDEHLARFRLEAELMSRIIHPNVVTLLDFGQEENLLFMAMEYLQGQTLDALVPYGSGLPLDTSLAIMEEVSAGVSAAHRAGLIHRDLKPENIFMAKQADGRSHVKVIDFGLARSTQSLEEPAGELTQRGRVVGSAGYVAPEHITGSRDFTPASDVYAMGATLFFMLAGKPPHPGTDNVAIMTAQLRTAAPSLDLPPGAPNLVLEGVVHRAMNRDPTLRYANPEEMLTAMHFVVKKAGQLGKSRADNGTVAVSNITIELQAPKVVSKTSAKSLPASWSPAAGQPTQPLAQLKRAWPPPWWALALACTLLGAALHAAWSWAWDRSHGGTDSNVPSVADPPDGARNPSRGRRRH